MVPAGELALVSPALSHRLPEVFRDADRYDPDRFGPARQEDRVAKYSLIAFGGGRHRCIGSTFAYQQIKVIWSALLQRFDFTTSSCATRARLLHVRRRPAAAVPRPLPAPRGRPICGAPAVWIQPAT